MATKKSSTTTTWALNKIVSFTAFLAVCLIAIAYCLSFIEVLAVLREVAAMLAFVVTAFVSFFYANSRRKNRAVYLIVWVIGVIAILVTYVLSFTIL